MPVELGDVLGTDPLAIEVHDASGALADGGSVNLTITIQDTGTTKSSPADFSVTHDGTGLYHVDYVVANEGLHEVRWVITGANAHGGSKSLPATLATRPRNADPGRNAISPARNLEIGVSAGGQIYGLRLRTNGRWSGGGQIPGSNKRGCIVCSAGELSPAQ